MIKTIEELKLFLEKEIRRFDKEARNSLYKEDETAAFAKSYVLKELKGKLV